MRRITVSCGSGVWRHPEWIADQIELAVQRRGASTIEEAVRIVAVANGWRATVWEKPDGTLFLSVYSERPCDRVVPCNLNVEAPLR